MGITNLIGESTTREDIAHIDKMQISEKMKTYLTPGITMQNPRYNRSNDSTCYNRYKNNETNSRYRNDTYPENN